MSITTLRKPASEENECLNVYQPGSPWMHCGLWPTPPSLFGFAPVRVTFVWPVIMKPAQPSSTYPVLTLNPKSRL